MIKVLTNSDILICLCREAGKPGIYLGFHGFPAKHPLSHTVYYVDAVLELSKAVPWLMVADDMAVYQLFDDKRVFVLFDTYAEMEAAFNSTVGDDGPTLSNPYKGIASVYALTCNAQGEVETENT